MKKFLLVLGTILVTLTGIAQNGNSCGQAIEMDSLNYQWIPLNAPIAQKWFTYTASSYTSTVYFFVYEDTAAGAPQISAVTLFKGTCGSQTVVDGVSALFTDTIIGVILSNPVPGNVYTIKVDYSANAAASTMIAIGKQTSSVPPPAPQAAYVPPVCPPNSCTLVDENFNYTASIPTPHNNTNVNWGSPFYYGYAPCWGDATGTPQIPNNAAYMWSWRTPTGGSCLFPKNTGEAIYRSLPALNPNNVYVLQYDYATAASSTTLDELHVLLTPTGSQSWPLTFSGNINLIVPRMQLDWQTSVTNSAFATRQVCFQVPTTGTFNNSDIVFFPWSTTCGNQTTKEHLFIDNVKIYEIDPDITVAYSGGGCHGTCAQLSTCPLPAGLVNYSWAPATGLSCTTCPNPVACPTVVTDYTVTITVVGNNTVSPTCPSVTAAVTVNPGCQGTAMTTGSVTGPVTVTGNNTLGSNITITGGTYNITNAVVAIQPNVSITVNSGATLIITNSNLYACTDMWQGIILNPGGRVRVTNSLVEDAIIAIDNSNGGVAYTTPAATIQATGSVFNCNRTGINQSNFQGTVSANYNTTTNFLVANSVFTCRCGITFPFPGGSLAQLNTYIGSTVNPSINDYYNVATLQAMTLKVPYLGKPAFEGIRFQNDGPPNNTSPVNYAYNVGQAGSGVTIFDNHTYGINATNATFSVTASAFQVPNMSPQGLFNLKTLGGYGIKSTNNNTNFYNGIYVNNSSFMRMIRGIENINYYDMDVNTNTLFSKQSIVPVGLATSIYPPEGGMGMYFKTPRFINANMSNNNIANINTCIDFVIDANGTYNATNNNEYVGPITVNNNTFADQFATNPVVHPSPYIGNAIIVDNVLAAAVGNANVAGGADTKILIQNSKITNAFNGILARNHQWQQLRDENNIITMIYQPTTYATETQQYGIEHDHDIYAILTGHYNDIYNNRVTGFSSGFSTANQPKFEPKKAIWSRYCTAHWDVCNTVTSAGRGFEFEGLHSNITWWNNTMSACGEAYTLSNGGVIGNQQPIPSCGGCTVPDAQDNQWPTGNFIETMCDGGSNAANSILYVQNISPPYKPTLNSQNGGVAYGATTLITANGPNTYNCASSAGPPLRVVENNSTVNARSEESNSLLNYQIEFFEKIVQDSMHYVSYPVENSIINKIMAYKNLARDSAALNGSTVLQNFYAGCDSGNIGLLTKIEDALYSRNYTLAGGLINGLIPTNSIEQNYRSFYRIYLQAQQGLLTEGDSSDLEALASSCPMINGMVVFQARTFHNSYYNEFKHYNDNCSGGDGDNREVISAQTGDGTSFINLYPNPTTGMVYVSGNDSENHYYKAEVFDMGGRLVLSQDLILEKGIGKFKLDAETGAYFLYLTGNENKGKGVYKIMISK